MPTSETQRTKKMTKEDKKRVRHVNSSDEESNDDSSYVDDYDDDETLGSQDTLSESDYDSESDEDFNDYERPITRRSRSVKLSEILSASLFSTTLLFGSHLSISDAMIFFMFCNILLSMTHSYDKNAFPISLFL